MFINISLICFSLLFLSCQKSELAAFKDGETAISEGDVSLLKKIIVANPNVVHQKSPHDQATLLHLAGSAGYHPIKEKMIHLLVSSGSDVNAKDNLGRTVAHRILYYGDGGEKLLPYFVKHGIDLSIVDMKGKKAEDYK